MTVSEVLEKDESGNYKLSEEQRVKETIASQDINAVGVFRIAHTLSDENKIKLIEKFNPEDKSIYDVLSIVKDIECLKQGMKYYKAFGSGMFVSLKVNLIRKFDEKTKVELLQYVDDDRDKHYIVTRFEDEQLKIEALQTILNSHYKADIVSTLSDENKIKLLKTFEPHDDNIYNILSKITDLECLKEGIKYYKPIVSDLFVSKKVNLIQKFDEKTQIELLQYLTTEKDRNHVIKQLKDDQLKISYLQNIQDINAKISIITTLSDEHKIEMLSIFNPEDDKIYEVLDEVKDVEYLKKGMQYYKAFGSGIFVSRKVNIIRKFDEKTQVELLQYVDDEADKNYIVTRFKDDQLKILALQNVFDPYYKATIISTLKDENTKVTLVEQIINDYSNVEDINLIGQITNTRNIIGNLIDKEQEILKIEDKESFMNELNKLGYGSKYRLIFKTSIQLDNDLILSMINEARNENDLSNLIIKLPEDIRMEEYNKHTIKDIKNIMKFVLSLSEEHKILYKTEVNEIFDNGKYKELSTLTGELINQLFDSKKQKVLNCYKLITKESLQKHFANYVYERYNDLSEDKIELMTDLLYKVDTSNSEEIAKQSDAFATALLESDNPLESFKKVENIFLKNHLPYVAKLYLTFLTVHPDFKSYTFKKGSQGNVSSPVLNNISLRGRKTVVLSDLLKNVIESNSIDFNMYLNKLEKGNKLYLQYKDKDYKSLSESDQTILAEFRDNLFAVYSNTLRSQNIESIDPLTDIKKIEELYPLANKNSEELVDRIISSFCHYVGIDSLKDLRNYMNQKLEIANNKNRNYKDFTLSKGDFIKGFDINYFYEMLQTGINAHDYLGASMSTDCTALDTDLSRIYGDTEGKTIAEIIDMKNRDSGMYGQGYIVIKDDPNKICITKTSSNEPDSRIDNYKNSMFGSKIEAFSNGDGHNISNPYGIRTGFSASNIDYIVFDEQGGSYKENLYKLVLPLALSGLYIPIISKSKGELLFGYEQYENLRNKMSGSKYYGLNNVKISKNIDSDIYRDIASKIDESNIKINETKSKIMNLMKEGLEDQFKIIDHINGTLDPYELQVLDTGSTGRSTNIPGKGDFDYVIRINRNIEINQELRQEFIEKLLSKFKIINPGKNIKGDIKEMTVEIDGEVYPLDISFTIKTNKVSYSTEMSVSDRLDTIKQQYPDKYKLVLANIIYAKELLKHNGCYKKGKYGEGGLGGVGVENWILQNGGSLYDASKEFLSFALKDDKIIDFETFKANYQVWDFGENFYTDRDNRTMNRKDNLHDNFISNNLTENGYKNMVSAIKTFVKNYEMGCLENFEEKTAKTI